MTMLARVLVLLLLASGLGVVANTVNPAGIPLAEEEVSRVRGEAVEVGLKVVELSQARRIVATGDWVILDARPVDDFEAGHIPGALSMPAKAPGERFAELQVLLVPAQPAMVYCSGSACDQGLRLGEFLQAQGLEEVALFEGGMEVWDEAGLEVEAGRW